jgi:hypothetical protein
MARQLGRSVERRDQTQFAKGYQEGMSDIYRQLEQGGEEAVREWLKNNYKDYSFAEAFGPRPY